jgi:hypothetical protein
MYSMWCHFIEVCQRARLQEYSNDEESCRPYNKYLGQTYPRLQVFVKLSNSCDSEYQKKPGHHGHHKSISESKYDNFDDRSPTDVSGIEYLDEYDSFATQKSYEDIVHVPNHDCSKYVQKLQCHIEKFHIFSFSSDDDGIDEVSARVSELVKEDVNSFDPAWLSSPLPSYIKPSSLNDEHSSNYISDSISHIYRNREFL